MKIIKAYIAGFGKIKNAEFNFESGINTYIYENGWGKTTLSVFIKSMFYGMEYTTSKDIKKNERLKYFPWESTNYGGSIDFEFNGKKYKVTRFFGKSNKDDFFELRDLKTNKICNDFSENLGTELFGINKETYARSVYVTLDESPKNSSDISAKLNNLIEAGDIANFENACTNLDKLASALQAKRGKNGKIFSIENQIDEKNVALEHIDFLTLENSNLEKNINSKKNLINELNQTQTELTEVLSQNAKWESKKHYDLLKKDVADIENSKTEILEYFNNNIPQSEKITDIDNLVTNYYTVETNIKNESLTQVEKDQYNAIIQYFQGDYPSKEEINNCLLIDSKYRNYKQELIQNELSEEEQNELSLLKTTFENKDISQEKINSISQKLNLIFQNKNAIIKNEAEYKIQSQEETKSKDDKKKKSRSKLLLQIISALFLIGGISSYFAGINLIVCILLFAFSVGMFFTSLFIFKNSKNINLLQSNLNNLQVELDQLKTQTQELENECKEFIFQFCQHTDEISDTMLIAKLSANYERYLKLKQKENFFNTWNESQEKNDDDYKAELLTFVKRYCKSENINSVAQDINILKDKLNRLDELARHIESDENNKKLFAELKEKLNNVFSQFKSDFTKDFSVQNQILHANITKLEGIENSLKNATEKLQDFENDPQNNISNFENLTKPEKDIEQVNVLLNSVSENLSKENQELAGLINKYNENLEQIDTKLEIESELENLKIAKKEKTKEHELLIKTIELLTKAKDNLDANYSDPMKDGFKKYLALAGGKLKLLIDTDLNVSVENEGKNYNSEYLSSGYKDLINFCSRMALVDALFENVKPPIILDDPFVNLDDEKSINARALIKEMAKEKQILYFACNKSRDITN